MLKPIFLKLKCIFLPCEANNYRPQILESRALAYLVLIVLLLKLFTFPLLVYLPKNIFFADITKNTLVQLINGERQDSGLKTLRESSQLDQAAYLKAQDMLEKDYFAHQSPEGIAPWYWFKKVGYNYQIAGENLAIGFLDSKEVVNAWMESYFHKQNIINPKYTETGMAVLRGDFQGSQVVVAVQLFGTPKTPTPKKETPEPQGQKPVSETMNEQLATSVLPAETQASSPEGLTKKEALSLNLTEFAVQDYSNWLQGIIYGLLAFVIISLLLALFYDIFVYKKYQIQHRDLIFKTVGFTLLLLIFLYIDKEKIIQLIPHTFSIY